MRLSLIGDEIGSCLGSEMDSAVVRVDEEEDDEEVGTGGGGGGRLVRGWDGARSSRGSAAAAAALAVVDTDVWSDGRIGPRFSGSCGRRPSDETTRWESDVWEGRLGWMDDDVCGGG